MLLLSLKPLVIRGIHDEVRAACEGGLEVDTLRLFWVDRELFEVPPSCSFRCA